MVQKQAGVFVILVYFVNLFDVDPEMTKNCAAFPSERHTKAPDFFTEEHRETNLIGVVVGIDEKRAPPWGQRPAVDAKTVILCCDEGLAGHHVQHRLVLASGKQREEKNGSFPTEIIKSYRCLMVCLEGCVEGM